MKIAKILNVIQRVPGSYFVSSWRYPMQIVETTEGIFIDNDSSNPSPSRHWKPIDCKALIGQKVRFTVHRDDGMKISGSEHGRKWIQIHEILENGD